MDLPSSPRFCSPETCLALLRWMERDLLEVGPELTTNETARILGDLELSRRLVDHVAERVKNSPEFRARIGLPKPEPLPQRRTLPFPRPAPCFPDAGGARWYQPKRAIG